MKIIILFFVVCCYANHASGMSEAQMVSTKKLVRSVCQPKSKATNDEVENHYKGIWKDGPNEKCYMNCVLQMLKVVKNGKLQYEAAIKAAASLPPKFIEPARKMIENCKDADVGDDFCESSYALAKCMYFDDPVNYFLA